MDWFGFVANLVDSLAWPIAAIVLVLFLRKPIKNLLPLLQRLKYKELELEFGKRVEEVKDELATELPSDAAILPPGEINALHRLAELSPRSVVLEAWRNVELAALEAARSIGGESFRNKTLTYQAIRLLERTESLDRNVISLLRDLRGLRNEAAHAPELALTKNASLEYAESAATVARYLRRIADKVLVNQ
jgi:hypothetical protein